MSYVVVHEVYIYLILRPSKNQMIFKMSWYKTIEFYRVHMGHSTELVQTAVQQP